MSINCRTSKYKYDPDRGVCTFEDGTVYTAKEMLHISRADLSREDEAALHLVKRVFDGEIDTNVK